jgi:hypothetical protein
MYDTLADLCLLVFTVPSTVVSLFLLHPHRFALPFDTDASLQSVGWLHCDQNDAYGDGHWGYSDCRHLAGSVKSNGALICERNLCENLPLDSLS